MKLYKNVTKTLLAVKTPRRLYVEPGMIIDVDALGDITRSDISMFIDRGVLVPVESVKKAKTEVPQTRQVAPQSKGVKSTTEVAAVKNKTVVVRSTVKDEAEQEPVTELGRVHKSGTAAAVVSAPPDTPISVNPPQASATKGAAFDALPTDVKEKIAHVEAMVEAKGTGPDEPAVSKKKAPKKAKK